MGRRPARRARPNAHMRQPLVRRRYQGLSLYPTGAGCDAEPSRNQLTCQEIDAECLRVRLKLRNLPLPHCLV